MTEVGPVKYVLNKIAPVLTHIYNCSLSTGIFPNNMQVARVIVVHKHGDKNTLDNYRPVSVLPIFSKGLEKVVKKHAGNFSQKHELITTRIWLSKELYNRSSIASAKRYITGF